MIVQKLHCFKCRKCIGFYDQGEPCHPIYCLPCMPAVLAERDKFAAESASHTSAMHTGK